MPARFRARTQLSKEQAQVEVAMAAKRVSMEVRMASYLSYKVIELTSLPETRLPLDRGIGIYISLLRIAVAANPPTESSRRYCCIYQKPHLQKPVVKADGLALFDVAVRN